MLNIVILMSIIMKIRTFGKEYVYYLEDEQALPVEKRAKFVYKTPTLATIIAGQDTTSIETDGKSLEEICLVILEKVS